MVRVKVCGIRNEGDARACLENGVHALGLVFFEPSPRYISPEEARTLIGSLPPLVSWVGVFVDEEPGKVLEIARYVGFGTVQLHGSEPPEVCEQLKGKGLRVIKALRVADEEDLLGWEEYLGKVSAMLLDTKVPDTPGGSGRPFPWRLAKRVQGVPVILAGGLNPQNIRNAILEVKPYGVDVSSGVERSPGVKDPALIRKFMRRVREL